MKTGEDHFSCSKVYLLCTLQTGLWFSTWLYVVSFNESIWKSSNVHMQAWVTTSNEHFLTSSYAFKKCNTSIDSKTNRPLIWRHRPLMWSNGSAGTLSLSLSLSLSRSLSLCLTHTHTQTHSMRSYLQYRLQYVVMIATWCRVAAVRYRSKNMSQRICSLCRLRDRTIAPWPFHH